MVAVAMLCVGFPAVALAGSGSGTAAPSEATSSPAAASSSTGAITAVTSSSDSPILEAPVLAPAASASSEITPPGAGDAHIATSGPSNLVTTPAPLDSTPPSTSEIPAAKPTEESLQEPPPTTGDSHSSFTEGGEINRYQQEQSGMPPQQLRDLQEFSAEGELSTPIGLQLREARRTLKTGEEVDGLLVTEVKKGSAAAGAGLHPYKRTTHNVITGAAVAAAMVFPPAILIIPVLDYSQIGESYDLIIGVDGSRVTNFLDFQDKTRDVQPGELIYFSIVRDGKRLQISVPVPSNLTQLAY
jgi:hypothetical protein